jgi:hypothetical protein
MVHLAPPCATFSRARDRNVKTILRSSAHPGGIPGCEAYTEAANHIATAAVDLAEWAAGAGAAVSLESPAQSYLWSYIEFGTSVDYEDAVFSPCTMGGTFRKPTRVRCWNWWPALLDSPCILASGEYSCGRAKGDLHPPLGFGDTPTAQAAQYEPGVCRTWSEAIRRYIVDKPTAMEARQLVRLHKEGRVRRHALRGTDADTAR